MSRSKKKPEVKPVRNASWHKLVDDYLSRCKGSVSISDMVDYVWDATIDESRHDVIDRLNQCGPTKIKTDPKHIPVPFLRPGIGWERHNHEMIAMAARIARKRVSLPQENGSLGSPDDVPDEAPETSPEDMSKHDRTIEIRRYWSPLDGKVIYGPDRSSAVRRLMWLLNRLPTFVHHLEYLVSSGYLTRSDSEEMDLVLSASLRYIDRLRAVVESIEPYRERTEEQVVS